MPPPLKHWSFGRRQITAAIIAVIAVAFVIGAYVQQSLSSIARDLPVTLLDQERDAETLIREMANLAWAIEFWRVQPSEDNRERVREQLQVAVKRTELLRTNYNLDNLVGAAGMFAVARPALQDIERWFVDGAMGQPAGSLPAIWLMQRRARDAEARLILLLGEGRDSARELLLVQEARLDRFSLGVALLTAFAALLVLGLVLLLYRQRVLLELREDAEVTLLAAKRTAEEANRAKSEFLANMSHELRTPLNAIIGFSTMIKDEMLGPVGQKRYRDYAADIHGSGEHLLAIISDILDLSKVEAGKMELVDAEFDAAEVMRAAIRLVREKAETDGLTLILRPLDQPVKLHADRRAVLQMLLNLLSNAVKFTERGSVELAAAVTASGGLRFSVRDTGIGMTSAQLAKVLEPFYQVQNALTRDQPGTGLGLPLVDRLIRLQGGRLEIESQPGIGTTASIELPPARVRS
ncbi:sensor histidine kinase [Ferrovibrio sp.]|uniref:sensor histidine kinase n=1 Tax=Ferrovibrio sp. TaxID=1917215 RepID=UPI003D120AAA